MRLLILSDLHTEFAPFDPPEVAADLVVLAGDIGVGLKGLEFARETFGDLPIVYVAGNHEFYRHAYPRLIDELRVAGARLDVDFLENDAVIHEGIRFLGCTLWSDFELFGDGQNARRCMEITGSGMTDYSLIRFSPTNRKITPHDTRAAHRVSRKFLEEELSNDFPGKTVVVTHCAPSRRSLPDRFLGHPLSAAFASDLEALIAESEVDLWIHGHTHHSVSYTLGETRVVSNQRCYPNEDPGDFDAALIVEV